MFQCCCGDMEFPKKRLIFLFHTLSLSFLLSYFVWSSWSEAAEQRKWLAVFSRLMKFWKLKKGRHCLSVWKDPFRREPLSQSHDAPSKSVLFQVKRLAAGPTNSKTSTQCRECEDDSEVCVFRVWSVVEGKPATPQSSSHDVWRNSRIRFTVGVTLPHGDGHNQIPELLVFEDLFVLCLHADVSPMRAARLLLRGPGAETHDSNQLVSVRRWMIHQRVRVPRLQQPGQRKDSSV